MRLRSLIRDDIGSFRDFVVYDGWEVELYTRIDQEPKKRFEREMFSRSKKKEYAICLNPLARDYTTGKGLFLKKAVRLRFSFYDFPVPSTLLHEVWFSPDSLTIELLKHGE